MPKLTRRSTIKIAAKRSSEISEAFRLFDKDNDGKITRKEIEELLKNLGGEIDCPHVQDLLKASDQSGGVDLPNFMKLWIEFKASVGEDGEDTEDDIKQAFKDYDTNGDGYITKEEMMQVIDKMGFVANKDEEVMKCLRDLDLDGDGRVSYAEFMVKWKIT